MSLRAVLVPGLVASALAAGLTACTDSQDDPAAPAPSASTSTTSSSSSATGTPAAGAPSVDGVHLVEAGVELPDRVLVFGTPADEAVAAVEAVLGEPTSDTGLSGESSGRDHGTCPGTLQRAVEFAGGALVLLLSDADVETGEVAADGELVLLAWRATGEGDPSAAPAARALVGDVTTLDVRVGTPLGDLRAAAPADGLRLVDGHLEDGSLGFELGPPAGGPLPGPPPGLRGLVSGDSATDTVTEVEAGVVCA